MIADTIFVGARILGAGVDIVGDLLVRDGLIADFGPSLAGPTVPRSFMRRTRCSAPALSTCGSLWGARV